MKHSRTVKHIDNVTYQNREKINNNKATDIHKDKIKRAKIKFCSIFRERPVCPRCDWPQPLIAAGT